VSAVIFYEDPHFTLHLGDCLDVMRELPAESVDAVVTDPPYGLEFMGKTWDRLGQPGIGTRPTDWVSHSSTTRLGATNPTCLRCGGRLRGAKKCLCDAPQWKPVGKRRTPETEGLPDHLTGGSMKGQMHRMQAWHEAWAREAFRLLKPGAHLLAFGGTRTVHRLTCAIEDAGFEIRDCLVWAYASGFPKSRSLRDIGRPELGTALKPSHEPVVLAQKPFSAVVEYEHAISELHHALSGLLCVALSPSASAAEGDSERSTGASTGGCASARASAAIQGLSDESSEVMGMSSSQELESIALSIASSWNAILAGLLLEPSRSTTAMASSTTTALRTLSSSLSPVTSISTMPRCGCLPAGGSWNAGAAASASSEEWGRWLDTLRHSVPAPAIRQLAMSVEGVLVAVADDLLSAWVAIEGSTAPATATTDGAANTPDTTRRPTDSRAESRPIVMARKPLRGTVAANVLAYGTGALNIDASRVSAGLGGDRDGEPTAATRYGDRGIGFQPTPGPRGGSSTGRWPANVVLTSDDEGRAIFDGGIDGVVGGTSQRAARETELVDLSNSVYVDPPLADYSRFFLIPKEARSGREPLVRGTLEEREGADPLAGHRGRRMAGDVKVRPDGRISAARANVHPTVKPLELMRHLVRLVTPPGGLVLDPFLGSGTTAIAANAEGFRCIGIEKEEEYCRISVARLAGQPLGLGLDVPAATRKRKPQEGHAGWSGIPASPDALDFYTRAKRPEDAA
jgi:DNA modification methylase